MARPNRLVMIVACPSCATHYDLPAQRFAADGTMIKCAACGHSWLEARAVEIASAPIRQVPAVIEHDFEPDQEIRRLMEASREARENFLARRKARLKTMRGWGALAASLATLVALAGLFPDYVVSAAPASVKAYQAIGRDINIYGLDLRRIELQHLIDGGTRVLAIRGEIANISGRERKIPWLRFGLRSGEGTEVYDWTLDSGARPLKPGEITTFVTRVASPPETARNIEIRFAHADEIGLKAAP